MTITDSRHPRHAYPGYAEAGRAANRRRRFHGAPAERLVLALMWAGAIAVVIATLTGAPWPVPPVPLIAHLAGMLAGYGAGIVLILVSRTPWLEHRIGADRLTRWHAVAGGATLILTLIHGVFAVFAVAEATRTSATEAAAIVWGLPDLVAAVIGTGLIFLPGLVSFRALRRRLRYETWHALHLLMYVGIAMGFAHQLAGPDIAGRPWLQIAWTLLYAAAFLLLLRYRIFAPVFSGLRHDLRVEAVETEGPETTTIVVRGRWLDELGTESGQFFRWRFLARSTWRSAHPFSISAPPVGDQLRLTIKVAGDGTRAISRLRPGTRVLAEGPYGAMTARRRRGAGTLLIAGGIGITPMRALLESLPRDGQPLTLLYRASSAEDVVFRDELDAIAAQRGAQIHYIVGRSTDPGAQLTVDLLTRLVPDVADRDVYICASPRFSALVRELLHRAEVPRERIHQEEFAF